MLVLYLIFWRIVVAFTSYIVFFFVPFNCAVRALLSGWRSVFVFEFNEFFVEILFC